MLSRIAWPLGCALLLAATGAAAQVAPQPPALLEQRIAAQIGHLVILNTSQGVQIEELQAALAAAQARLEAIPARRRFRHSPQAAE